MGAEPYEEIEKAWAYFEVRVHDLLLVQDSWFMMND